MLLTLHQVCSSFKFIMYFNTAFHSGWFNTVRFPELNCVMKADVEPFKGWVWTSQSLDRSRKIITGHSSYMARLASITSVNYYKSIHVNIHHSKGEVCSHISAILFIIEACGLSNRTDRQVEGKATKSKQPCIIAQEEWCLYSSSWPSSSISTSHKWNSFGMSQES